jgi:predicted GH43/DUF377 family glycosyl hydrolase
MKAFRSPQNPIIAPVDVKPSREDFEIIGVLNAGVTKLDDEVILLVRVAERPIINNNWPPRRTWLTENSYAFKRSHCEVRSEYATAEQAFSAPNGPQADEDQRWQADLHLQFN